MTKEGYKPEDIRPDEPETRVVDIEKAKVMAEAGHTDRSVAAFERQLAKILKSHKSGELSRKELETATKELISVYPEEHETPFSEYTKRHEHLSQEADKNAEKLEDWTGVLFEHPAKGWTPEKLANKERDAIYCENIVGWIERDCEKLKKMIDEGGFYGFNFKNLHPKVPKQVIVEAENKFSELTRNPETTVKQLTEVVYDVFRKGAEYFKEGAMKHREVLDKIKKGEAVPEPKEED